MIEFRLRDHLAADTNVAAIVGTRIHPVRIPRMDNAYDNSPCLTYRRKTGGRDHYVSGASGHPRPVFEIALWSQSYDSAKLAAQAVRQAMDGFSGTFTDVTVKVCKAIDEEDGFIRPEDGSDDGWFVVRLDYEIMYVEDIPTFA